MKLFTVLRVPGTSGTAPRPLLVGVLSKASSPRFGTGWQLARPAHMARTIYPAAILALAALIVTVPLHAGIGLFIGPPPPNDLLAYEPFDYRADERLSQSNGGQGFSGGWSASLPGAVGSEFTIGTSLLASPGLSEDGAHARTPGS